MSEDCTRATKAIHAYDGAAAIALCRNLVPKFRRRLALPRDILRPTTLRRTLCFDPEASEVEHTNCRRDNKTDALGGESLLQCSRTHPCPSGMQTWGALLMVSVTNDSTSRGVRESNMKELKRAMSACGGRHVERIAEMKNYMRHGRTTRDRLFCKIFPAEQDKNARGGPRRMITYKVLCAT